MFENSVCGGTFDLLHSGHKNFLRNVLADSRKIYVGLTSDTYVSKHKKNSVFIASYAQRKKMLESFFTSERRIDAVFIEPIDSVFYPESWEKIPFDAIFVTEDSLHGALEINEDRGKKGLPLLEIVIVPLTQNDRGQKFSSSLLRSENPVLKKNLLTDFSEHMLLLPHSERKQFHQPFGKIVRLSDIDFPSLIGERTITVGDIVTSDFNRKNTRQWISLVDFAVQRIPKYKNITELGFSGFEITLSADNPPGHLTIALWKTIKHALTFKHQRVVIHVNGEEDLAVLPLVILAPIGITLFYGQPHQGVVQVEITQNSKAKAYELLTKFEIASTRGS